MLDWIRFYDESLLLIKSQIYMLAIAVFKLSQQVLCFWNLIRHGKAIPLLEKIALALQDHLPDQMLLFFKSRKINETRANLKRAEGKHERPKD